MTTIKAIYPARRAGPSRVLTESTVEKHTSGLDARSIVALEWTQHWLQRHTSLKAPAAVIVRRALVLLADHLSNLDAREVAHEGHILRDAGRGKGSAVTLTEARARLERHVETYRGKDAPGPQPMGHWLDMLHSIEDRKASRAMLDKLELLMGGSA
jgi:hypothetical protein